MIAVSLHNDEKLVLRVNYREAMDEVIDICKKYNVSYDYYGASEQLPNENNIRMHYFVSISNIPITKILDFWKEINSKAFLIFINRRKVA